MSDVTDRQQMGRYISSMNKRLWIVLLFLMISGCGTQADSTEGISVAGPTSSAEFQHSVPLDQIIFDTFRATDRAVPYTEASPKLIAQLQDAIPPIHTPRYQPAARARWLSSQDRIIGYSSNGDAWAYPIKILNYHEIVNDELNGEPVLISYCPLCDSGVVYSRRLGERILKFGNTSALYESDMVMLDYETGSYWWQVAGVAIAGELTDAQLVVLPSQTTTWGEWQAQHPDTLILSRDTGFDRSYSRNPFANYAAQVDDGNFAFPVNEDALDDRLSAGTRTLAVKIGEAVRAYPLLAGDGLTIINDEVNEQPLAIVIDHATQTGHAYLTTVAGQSLTLRLTGDHLTDVETGSRWNRAGFAIAGELTGQQLASPPTKASFWFAIVAAEPTLTLYDGPTGHQ